MLTISPIPIRLPNELTWHVHHLPSVGRASIIPASQLEDMTDSEIGWFVRHLMPESLRSSARHVSAILLNSNSWEQAIELPSSFIAETLQLLEQYAGDHWTIDEALLRIHAWQKAHTLIPEPTLKQRLMEERRLQFGDRRPELLLALIERDGEQCAYCGCTSDLSIDHITPLSRGGSDNLDNLQLLCLTCNNQKGDQMPESCQEDHE